MKIIILMLLFFASKVFATRPVVEKISRTQLIQQSTFIFSGWPATQAPEFKCPSEFKRWWVHKVYKGDKNLEGKIISLSAHNYKFNYKGAPSHKSFLYGDGQLVLEQGTSFIYTKQNQDGCFELSAQGAQDHSYKEPLIDSLFKDKDDCPAHTRALEFLLDKMPKDCQSDTDCIVYLKHPFACSRPYFFSTQSKKEMDEDFLVIENRALEACKKNFEFFSQCKAFHIPNHCKKNKCSRGYSSEALKNVKFTKATISSSCAPHDGPSTRLMISGLDKNDPNFALHWWGKNHKNLFSDHFTFQSQEEKEYSHSFCSTPHGCKGITKSKFVIEKDKSNEKTVKFFIETIDQEVFEGVLPISPPEKNVSRLLCG